MSSQREKRGFWDQLVDCICRPPRDEYTLEELIGGTRGKFTIDGRRYKREDFELVNKRGQRLKCSHYRGRDLEGSRPCVIYCHCNSGSRRDAEEALYVLLPHGITVMCFDFAGSGLSDGEWVTLGAHEVDDLVPVVDHLRKTGTTSRVGLWGRSMGAVTAMLYARLDPSIAGIVVDSPFSRLTDLMIELAVEQKLPIPRPLMKVAQVMMKRSVRKRAGFNIDEVAPIDFVGEAFVPALFGHAVDDTFVDKHHTERLNSAYAGDKNLVTFRGDHNSVRPSFFYSSVLIFFHNVLQCEQALPASSAVRSGHYGTQSQAGSTRKSLPPAPGSVAGSRATSHASMSRPALNGARGNQQVDRSLTQQGHVRRGSGTSTSSDSTARSERVASANGPALSSAQRSTRVPSHPLQNRPMLEATPSVLEDADEGSVLEGEDAEVDAELQAALLASMADAPAAIPAADVSGSGVDIMSVANRIKQWPPQTSRGTAPEVPLPPGIRPEDAEAAMIATAIKLSLGEAQPSPSVQKGSPPPPRPQPPQPFANHRVPADEQQAVFTAGLAVPSEPVPSEPSTVARSLCSEPADSAAPAVEIASASQAAPKSQPPPQAQPEAQPRALPQQPEIQPQPQPQPQQQTLAEQRSSELRVATSTQRSAERAAIMASAFAAASSHSSSMTNLAARDPPDAAPHLQRRASPVGASSQGSGALPSSQGSGALPGTPTGSAAEGQVTPKAQSVKGGSPPPPSPTGSAASGASSSRASTRSGDVLKAVAGWIFPGAADGLKGGKSASMKRLSSGGSDVSAATTSSTPGSWLFPSPADALPKAGAAQQQQQRLIRSRSGGSDRERAAATTKGAAKSEQLLRTRSGGRTPSSSSSGSSAALGRPVVDISALGTPASRRPPRALRSNSLSSSIGGQSPTAAAPADSGLPVKAANDMLRSPSADSVAYVTRTPDPLGEHVGAAPGAAGELALDDSSIPAEEESKHYSIDEIGRQASNDKARQRGGIDQVGVQHSDQQPSSHSPSIQQVGKQPSGEPPAKYYSIDQVGTQSSNEQASSTHSSLEQAGEQSSCESPKCASTTLTQAPGTPFKRTQLRARARAAAKDSSDADDLIQRSCNSQGSIQGHKTRSTSNSSAASLRRTRSHGGDAVPSVRTQSNGSVASLLAASETSISSLRRASGSAGGSSTFSVGTEDDADGGGGGGGDGNGTMLAPFSPAARRSARVPTDAQPMSPRAAEPDPLAAKSKMFAAFNQVLQRSTPAGSESGRDSCNSSAPHTPKAGAGDGPFSVTASVPMPRVPMQPGDNPFSVSTSVPMPRMPIQPAQAEIIAFNGLVTGQLISDAVGSSSTRRASGGKQPPSCDVSDSETNSSQLRGGTRMSSRSLPFSGHDGLTAAQRRVLQSHELADVIASQHGDNSSRNRRKSSLGKADAAKMDVVKAELTSMNKP